MKLVFDIETDGLLDTVSNIWSICATDILTNEKYKWRQGEDGWKEIFNKAQAVIGHNIVGYDLPVLEKLTGFKLDRRVQVIDTLLISQILDFFRFNGRHSLEVWGEFFNFPKDLFNDYSQWSIELENRCLKDVELSIKVYKHLQTEFQNTKTPGMLKTYIEAENYVQEWSTKAYMEGWPIDKEKAYELLDRLDTTVQDITKQLEARLGMKCVPVDKKKGIVEPKKPKWIKTGCYDAHTSNWFKIDPYSGFPGEEQLVLGEYSRVSFEHLKLSSSDDVKTFLFRHGWTPTEWNYVRDEKGKKVKSSPKITEDSLEFLGGDGKLYREFTIASSRMNVLKTWLENLDDNNRLHGKCITVGTPSMRARHQIIVNIPSADSVWGKEMRSLFGCLPGYKLVGCDSSGNQARGLAYYLGNQEFIDTLLNGDIHTYNANILTSIGYGLGASEPVTRNSAKRILYAFLFGASGEKLWFYAYGHFNKELGNKFKTGFIKAVPGFKELVEKLEKIFSKTSQMNDRGYIYSLVGNKIYVDSFHKLLVYLLQSLEKITCSAATMLIMKRLEEENIPYIPLILYHDETDFMVPEEYAERARLIGKQAFKDGPKLFGIDIMDGEGKIGNNWYEIH